MKVYFICCILAQIPCLGYSGSWDMGQNALGQSDCRILKSTRSLEQSDEKAWFFVSWCKFMKIKSWLKYIEGEYSQKWVWPFWGHRTLKLAVSQYGINGINWFMVCWYKFRRAKSYFNNFWVVVVKSGCGILLGNWTLKSAASQEWIDVKSWFFACWYKFKKAKSFRNWFSRCL